MENCPEQCHAPLQRYSSCILNRSGYFSSRKTQTFLMDPFSDDGIKQYLEWFECKQGACIYCQKRIVFTNTAPCAISDWSSGSTDIILQTNVRRSHQRSVLLLLLFLLLLLHDHSSVLLLLLNPPPILTLSLLQLLEIT